MTTESPITPRFRVPSANLPALQVRIDDLNKKAEKLGTDPVGFTVLSTWTAIEPNRKFGTMGDERAFLPIRRYSEVEVFGPTPKYEGWELIGTVDHSGAMNLVCAVPGESLPTEFRLTANTCDHCNTRRSRKLTVVVRNEEGDIKRVGRSCLKDFLGHASPEKLARMAEFLRSVLDLSEDDWEGDYSGGSSWSGYDPADFMDWVAQAYLEHGWAPASSDCPTADTAMNSRFDHMRGKPHKAATDRPGTKALELSAKVMEWVGNLKHRELRSDYLWNLMAVFENEFIPYKRTRLAASAIIAFIREEERELKRRMENERRSWKPEAESAHFGNIKERSEYLLTLVGLFSTEGYHGTIHIHKFRTESGDVAVWFGSKDVGMEKGKTYRVKATVKKHDERKGVPQTILTRVAPQDWDEEGDAAPHAA